MPDNNKKDPMLEVFLLEANQQISDLEQAVLTAESENCFSSAIINDIFRNMHTIKSSSAMMMFNNISKVAHSTEDLFYFMREEKPKNIDTSSLCDIVLESIDFIKLEIEKIENNDAADGDETALIENLHQYLDDMKTKNGASSESDRPPKDSPPPEKQQFYIASDTVVKPSGSGYYKVHIQFEEDCEMENIRAFQICHQLKEVTDEIKTVPSNIIDENNASEIIQRDGFNFYIKTKMNLEKVQEFFKHILYIGSIKITQLADEKEYINVTSESDEKETDHIGAKSTPAKQNPSGGTAEKHGQIAVEQSNINVNVIKLDKLMDLVSELVIAESMVTENPDLDGLELNNFKKAARHLEKIAKELQHTVLDIRMVPLKTTFMKMNRIIRDMNKKLGKNVQLTLIGENTEVDKKIIEHIGDPLMHIVRNSVDHGIESAEERLSVGKDDKGNVTIEAKNVGNEVHISVKDDGKGLDKKKILKKAQDAGILTKPVEEMTDDEINKLIFLPGFSTNQKVTEFSGRGVGMDVVCKNIESVGGTIDISSVPGKGTAITMKIPLTLAIISGMTIKVGNANYSIPLNCVQEMIKPGTEKVFTDNNNNEMIMIRGECFPILRLYKRYGIDTKVTNLEDGMIIMIACNGKTICLFCDKVVGKHQIVIKPLPAYLKKFSNLKGIAGCTLLGNGSISLILDVNGLV